MTCSCPKCDVQVEFDSAAIPAEGSFVKCSECSASLVIRKESFARRALYKGDEVACAECGDHPGASIYCQNCHAIYPDFLLVETSSAAKKQFGKLLASYNIFKKIKIGTAAKAHHDPFVSSAPAKKTKGLKLPKQPAQLAAIAALIVMLLAGGGYYWYQDKIATEYTENYVRAIMGVKTARDLEIRISNRLATGMKTGASAALTVAEQKSATTASASVATLMKRLGKVPEKFTASDAALTKLSESYTKLHATVTSPTGSADGYSAAVKKSDDEFMTNARELKTALPEKIANQLAESRQKYKQLQDF